MWLLIESTLRILTVIAAAAAAALVLRWLVARLRGKTGRGVAPDDGVAAGAAAAADGGGFGDRLHLGIEPSSPPAGRRTAPALPAMLAEMTPGPGDPDAARREVYALYEIAQTLGSSLRLTEVLDLVVCKIGALVPYRTCAIYLRDEGRETLSARLVSGDNAAALRGRSIRSGDGVTGWAAAHGRARLSSSVDLDLADTRVNPADYGTVAAFPLRHDAVVLGVITLFFPRGAGDLEPSLRLMEIIARLSAGAVFHGTLFESGENASPIDDLTSLPSPRHLGRFFDQERIRSEQSARPLALLMMDIDDFKTINDRFGHATGDRYLVEISRVLRNHLRHRDVLVRLSGDEFAALLPATGFAAAALLAGRLQHAVDLYAMKIDGGRSARAGLSVGVAIHPQDGETLEDLLPRADANMYLNKKGRKNGRAGDPPNVIPFPTRSPGS